MAGKKEFQKRSPAIKVGVTDLLTGSFIWDEENRMNYLRTLYGEKVSRANLICSVLLKSPLPNEQSIVIDDGSGKILVRSFDNPGIFDKVNVGDTVLIIGKPREFNKETYISAEIVKKVDSVAWLNIRKAELQRKIKEGVAEIQELRKQEIEKPLLDKKNAQYDMPRPNGQDIMGFIRKQDSGQGVSLSDLIKKYGSEEIKNEIDYLIKRGDIFELRPGLLKVLE